MPGVLRAERGSDLAAAAIRARLVDGEWHIDGQKIWMSGAHRSTGIFVLARTEPAAAKHRGLSSCWCRWTSRESRCARSGT